MQAALFHDQYAHIPHAPGIYKYYDAQERILYVGKAKDLKKRISSYFHKNAIGAKTQALVRKIARIEFILVESEHDALLLESNLIKQYRPKYNILLKDDKKFPFIVVSEEAFPRIFLSRNKHLPHVSYIGPFSSVAMARALMAYVLRTFFIRTCALPLTEKNVHQQRFRPCLQYHLGNCKAPCTALQSMEDYRANVQLSRAVLKGKVAPLIKQLKADMYAAAEKWEFEKAQQKKNQIELLRKHAFHSEVETASSIDADIIAFNRDEHKGYVCYLLAREGKIIHTHWTHFTIPTEDSSEDILSTVLITLKEQLHSNATTFILPFLPTHAPPHTRLIVPVKGEKKRFLELAERNIAYYKENLFRSESTPYADEQQRLSLQSLQKDLSLPSLPLHIESFDNSHFQGFAPVSAMVCFKDGLPSRKDYRTFKVKTVEGIDDFATMREAVLRRYTRLVKEGQPLPQLIIIDGGKGQLNAAFSALKACAIHKQVSIISLAKKLEEVFVPHLSAPITLPFSSASLSMLRKIRDETHRFVINFHRRQRSKGSIRTELTKIKGIGKKLSEQLLLHFPSVEAIRKTPASELAKWVGQSRAEKIKKALGETGE